MVETSGKQRDFESLFRLEWDSASIEREIIDSAPELAIYLGAFSGLRVMRPGCSAESFFSFLCTPNNNLSRIVPMVRFLATLGPVMATVEGRPVHRFPDAATLASTPEVVLRANGFGYRAATIPAVAGLVCERGAGWIESLKSAPYDEVHSELCSLKGVGPKLADCIALFALDHTEAIPIDTHVWQAYGRLYRPERIGLAITDARYREASNFLRSKFGKNGGWAQQFLFYDNMLNRRGRP